jgi:hypothetical protein
MFRRNGHRFADKKHAPTRMFRRSGYRFADKNMRQQNVREGMTA